MRWYTSIPGIGFGTGSIPVMHNNTTYDNQVAIQAVATNVLFQQQQQSIGFNDIHEARGGFKAGGGTNQASISSAAAALSCLCRAFTHCLSPTNNC
ncbi:hypothetical protein ACS0PU_001980 [Formica fusca]